MKGKSAARRQSGTASYQKSSEHRRPVDHVLLVQIFAGRTKEEARKVRELKMLVNRLLHCSLAGDVCFTLELVVDNSNSDCSFPPRISELDTGKP